MRQQKFDWLEKVQEEIYEQIKELTLEEEVAYWQQRNEAWAKERQEERVCL
jgi:hypothetical protein